MKCVVQRIHQESSLINNNKLAGKTNVPGLMVLLSWGKHEQEEFENLAELHQHEKWLLDKIIGLRIFPDQEGKMNLSLEQYAEESVVYWVPQFTLYASLKSGFRPSFTKALDPKIAQRRFEICQSYLKSIATNKSQQFYFGKFGADMELQFSNWGPVTLILEK